MFELARKWMGGLGLAAGLIVSGVGLESTATAGHDTPLEAAAYEYRESIREFERLVHRSPHIERYDARLVSRLEDVACELYSAARRPEDVQRLMYHFGEVESLAPRVGQAIFARDCYPPSPVLSASWDRASCAYARVVEEMQCFTRRPVVDHRHPSHRHPIDPRDVDPWRDGPSRTPSPFGYGSYRQPFGVPAIPQPRFGVPATPFPSNANDFNRRSNMNPYFGTQVSPNHAIPAQRIDSRDVGAMVVGSLLTHLLNR